MSTPNTTPENRSAFRITAADLDNFDLHAAVVAGQRARAEAVFDAFAALGRAIGRLVRALIVTPLESWSARRRVRAELGSLDDYMLRDIGLTRNDIPYVVRTGVDPRGAANENRRRAA